MKLSSYLDIKPGQGAIQLNRDDLRGFLLRNGQAWTVKIIEPELVLINHLSIHYLHIIAGHLFSIAAESTILPLITLRSPVFLSVACQTEVKHGSADRSKFN
jgi:hypothetical protein